MIIQVYRYRVLNRTSNHEEWQIKDFTSELFPYSDEDIKYDFEEIQCSVGKLIEYELVPTTEKEWLTKEVLLAKEMATIYEKEAARYQSLLDSLGPEELGAAESSDPDKPQKE